jgi:two-component system KDP operon response regulator KdpE
LASVAECSQELGVHPVRIQSASQRSTVFADKQLLTMALSQLFDNAAKYGSQASPITVGVREVHLTPKEFEMLRYLMQHAGRPVPHHRLLTTIWGPEYGNEREYLRVLINQLRKKIEDDPARPSYILTESYILGIVSGKRRVYWFVWALEFFENRKKKPVP